MKQITKSVEETQRIAAEFVRRLTQVGSKARVIALCGDLGSGKTTFVQGVAQALGITATITSPTFVIVKTYQTTSPVFTKLVHMDAYRLQGGKEIETVGFSKFTSDPENLVLIEWPERMGDMFLSDIERVNFTFIDAATREIELP